jgi:hypothetical protein
MFRASILICLVGLVLVGGCASGDVVAQRGRHLIIGMDADTLQVLRRHSDPDQAGDNDELIGKEGVCAPIFRGCLRAQERSGKES